MFKHTVKEEDDHAKHVLGLGVYKEIVIRRLKDGYNTEVNERGTRLSTIQGATRILFIDKGRILEEGSHEDLISRERYYWKLYNTQHESFEVGSRHN